MTCVWDGIINKLGLKLKRKELLKHLKKNNVETNDIVHNGICISKKLMNENKQRVKNISEKEMGEGYLFSSCDPLMFLIAQLYDVTIVHNFNGNIITYKNLKYPKRIINFESSSTHFW